jgi:hypothetical protein
MACLTRREIIMGFAIGLILGALAGIFSTALCVSGRSKNVFTNADRLSLDTDRLAKDLYDADDFMDVCKASFNANEFNGCKYCDGGKHDCKKCIKEWLEKEVDSECRD